MKIKTILSKPARAIAMLLLLLSFTLNVHAQQVNIQVKDRTIKEVLKLITAQTGYNFIYSDVLAELNNKISLAYQADNETIQPLLSQVFANTNIFYTIQNKQVILQNNELKKNGTVPAQQSRKKIDGKVFDTDGLPLAGAYIYLKDNQSVSAIADHNGVFSVNIPGTVAAGKLVVSFIGMKQLEVDPKPNLILTMEPDSEKLDDVYVTGFQTISKERATGSFAKVTSTELEKKPVLDISNALIGLIPGLVSSSGNADGKNNRFIIRGKGTFQGQEDTDPLIVIDNFPIQGFASGSNPFETINPSDVENITVLKDAAATSIYGARAANGVIVITTKKGKNNERMKIQADAFVSISQKADLDYAFNFAGLNANLEYLDRLERYAASYNSSEYNPYYRESNPVVFMPKLQELMYEHRRRESIPEEEYNRSISRLQANEGKWIDDYNRHLFRNQISQKYNLGISGGSEKNRYNFSMSYSREGGANPKR